MSYDDNNKKPYGVFASSQISSGTSSLTGASKDLLSSLVDSAAPGLQFTLTVTGQAAALFVVSDFSLTESLSSPWTLDVNLVSAEPDVDFARVLDGHATLNILQGGTLLRKVSGMIAAFEQGNTGLHQTQYRMTLRPELWRTSLRRNCRIFQQQTPEDIITTLLRERGILNARFVLRYPHPAREFCVQYQEDDLSFIQRLSAEEGICYWFDSNQDGKMVFADDAGPLPADLSLPWNPDAQPQTGEFCVNQFIRSAQVKAASVQLKDYTFKRPLWYGLFTEEARKLHNQRPDYEYYMFPGRFKDDQHGQDYTRYHLEGLRNDADGGYGISNAPQLFPGLLFTLTSHPRASLNTRWQVVSITHTGSQPQALERASQEQGTTLGNRFTFIPAHQTWRPAPLPKPRVDGAQIGIVVGPPDEEIYCDDHGRVRVQFPWDRYGCSDDKSSCWIRVSQPWAGNGWGMIATPRIGQEVIVDFLHGDQDQPIIIGRTYHANNLPSIGLPAAKTQMAFRSKTHKGEGYNELMFEDANGQEMLSMHAQKDMSTHINNDRTTTVGANHSETVKGNQRVQIQEGNRTVIVSKGDESKSVKAGALTEDIAKEKSITADSINVFATGLRVGKARVFKCFWLKTGSHWAWVTARSL
ncbi:type VI secretion system tip protein VgrG [Erwinia tracheiphila]|uniref:type VI secretion system Vgr family protein n=2 Tax=Erwinia tracheiphila TaxID=65700 RepID=UPI00033CCB0A|nr:type VI secretion system tip protein VgrG [Erwinia tracheiphila]EOS92582.1 ImpA family type VI secretion-associated protein [Erwinia tracheiphila PSU-1]UIA87716.1 type VI secretion system tip protein VgrG [Erwinia tracheiphila]UIA89298.1 type VI secretion system tip protein VgrG [Erwinia tracheiphila]UIA96081.1 type VI secretion system tip protein VgrG [Erwinia tracheiphila]UIA97681.1 type VI secretion system tip protein VgrG [Erwinia tracheiphila]